MANESDQWPALPFAAWENTYATLHLWTQIVGKIRLANTPWINHSWHVTLYVTTRGLTTSPIPQGTRSVSIDFDFVDHRLLIQASDKALRILPLRPQTVAEFYSALLDALTDLGFTVSIYGKPNEIADPVPFAEDHEHADYDPEYVYRLWCILLQVHRVFQRFRARFIGKCSPVHFFWGSFDLAVTRFSGRPAPMHPGGILNLPDWVVREAYSHQQSSCGFWPGGTLRPYPFFFSYVYPEPEGFRTASVAPEGAFYDDTLREFILPYDRVRASDAPDLTLLAFLESTYAAGADLGNWDRATLERATDPRQGH